MSENYWIPLFDSTCDSTLWEEPLHVRVTFLTMLMNKGPDQKVRMPLRRLSKKANLDEDREKAYRLAEDAIEVLRSPDMRNPEEQEFEGRRIEKLDGEEGWLILNGAKYDEMRQALSLRLRKSREQRERRQKAKQVKKGPLLPGEALAVRMEKAAGLEAAEKVGEGALPDRSGLGTATGNGQSGVESGGTRRSSGGAEAIPDDGGQVGLPPGPEFQDE